MSLFKRKKEQNIITKKTPEAALNKPVQSKETAAAGVIKSTRFTEKSSLLVESNKYVFTVSGKANKNQIADNVRTKFGVNVVSVNIINLPAKERRRGAVVGHKPGIKKAVVTIKEGQKIEIQ